MSAREERFQSFKEFYPYYLSEHSNQVNRFLHCIGSTLVILELILFVVYGKYWLILAIPFTGYGFAWVGHFFIEKNKPATFKYPLWSLAADFVMLFHVVTFQINKHSRKEN